MTSLPARPPAAVSERGFTLIELLITLAITTLVLGGSMAALGDAVKLADAATLITGLNDNLRNGVDLMVSDLQQAGQGLPSGRVIQIPSGVGAQAIRLPGPPTTGYTYEGTSFCPPPSALCAQVTAIIPGPGRGPEVVPGTATDMVTILAADSAFLRADGSPVRLVAFPADASSVTIEPGVNITDGGPDDIDPGDLLMLTKGSTSVLVQVSSVAGQEVRLQAGDSLRLNQPAAAGGTAVQLRAGAPAEVLTGGFLPTTATRIRMTTYYLDVTADPLHPRLARRINNGDPVTFNNLLGTVIAFDIENLSITYDMADAAANRTNVRMTAADLQGGGACGASPCSPNQIRKANIFLSGRSRLPRRGTQQFFRNHLFTQVSLRSMAFVDRYR